MRQNIPGHSPYEKSVGFSRVVVIGDRAITAGTVAIDEDGDSVAPNDAGAQAAYVFGMLLSMLEEAGFGANDVVRTRMFVTDIADEPAVAAAHASRFRNVRPAATMIQVGALVRPELKVEIEIEAQKS